MKEQRIKKKGLAWSFDIKESHRFCTDFSASLMLARKACHIGLILHSPVSHVFPLVFVLLKVWHSEAL